jgi:hypothetical protein
MAAARTLEVPCVVHFTYSALGQVWRAAVGARRQAVRLRAQATRWAGDECRTAQPAQEVQEAQQDQEAREVQEAQEAR